MSAVGLLLHHVHGDAAHLAREAASWLTSRGHEVRLPDIDADAAGLNEYAYPIETLTKGLDLAVSLGGDGTMLRTVDLVADDDVPVLGVNLGHLGYLSEVEPAHLEDALARFFDGRHTIERRMRLAADVEPATPGSVTAGVRPALNEAGIGKTPTGPRARRRETI